MPRNTKAVEKHAEQPAPLTTAQSLGSIIKSARDTMRKDKGLNGDLGRLPLLSRHVDGKPSPPRAAADGTRTQGTPRASISRAANHGEPRSSGMQSTTQSEHLAQ